MSLLEIGENLPQSEMQDGIAPTWNTKQSLASSDWDRIVVTKYKVVGEIVLADSIVRDI
jgi:hypothetical protein